ncbi:hypothetical protein GGQ85_000747 [Nitrobacter vulgaris]|uniref:hypothetical protein n=1 Tax=Nitrobacter vulgaris TaxID=29421 RepID=UPI002863AC9D|nr:hypothetical protein [Nitrobacter vulgaris]MDR6303066.1 hypothetical protein [Nitrobacter vulgaris]
MVRLKFTIPEIGSGILGFVPGLDVTGVDDEGRKTLVRLIESTATLPELAKRVGVTINDMHKRAQNAVMLRPVITGDFFEARYMKRDLAEWWRSESSMMRWKPKKMF